tara:strand:- start:2100 stop:3545 length:1446 start_codon:yes stop_codon:yes gene_type:complete
MQRTTARWGWGLAALLLLTTTASAQEAQKVTPWKNVTEAVGLKGLGAGIAHWIDFDGDGWVDLWDGGTLFHNQAGKSFKKVESPGVSGGGCWGDFDGDGKPDFYTPGGGGRLFRNEGGGKFKHLEGAVPKLPMAAPMCAVWGDFSGDGLLDLYVGGYEAPAYQIDVRYRNQGDGTFKEVWRTSGSPNPARGLTTADFDEDGDLDIYVSNYRLVPNYLWQNDGKGNLSNVSKAFGTDGDGGLGAWGHTIGSCFGDLDSDGRIDIFVGNFSHPPAYQDRPKFLRNLGKVKKYHFEDLSKQAGLRWQESYASPALGDYDNDGLLDLFFTTVYPGDKSVLYRNLGSFRFKEIPGAAGMDRPQTYQAAWADWDNNGSLDLVVGGGLYQNPGAKGHWIKVRLVGTGKVNTMAIGATVRIRIGGDKERVITRHVTTGTGQGNQPDAAMHFGLGDHTGNVTVEVTWPGGGKQSELKQIDRVVTIRRAEK